MAGVANTTYILADHSKLGHTALARFGNLHAWAGLITDDRCPPGLRKHFKQAGISLL